MLALPALALTQALRIEIKIMIDEKIMREIAHGGRPADGVAAQVQVFVEQQLDSQFQLDVHQIPLQRSLTVESRLQAWVKFNRADVMAT
ncbi:hypothetical protein FGO68_gene9542 [Halteria grandinella]|uniref:Uncharacterized protein n=1 Tax=Halteria grandinella TaxID=5974 RepID=A0A8J8SZQ7_HALGN|nr:hypothetical protein FGO68_gene9542 [Halteria grandinella]